jgi:hypothetical protein
MPREEEASHAMIDELRKGLPCVRAPAAAPGSLPSSETPARHLLASLILPSLESAIPIAQEAQTRRELALAAIGLKRHQILKGSLPEDLQTLVPAILKDIPVDWIDGQPLRYRRLEPAEFRLYSVGADGRDDGGDPTSTNGLSRTLSLSVGRDFVWPEAVSLEGADPAPAAGSKVGRSP